jgi:hypothetical protein
MMMSCKDPFFRHYRAVLLDYLAAGGESGLACAYELSRKRIEEGDCLLQVVRVHQRAVNSILESTPVDDRLTRLTASDQFLMEALSAFDMAARGYVALLDSDRALQHRFRLP